MLSVEYKLLDNITPNYITKPLEKAGLSVEEFLKYIQ